MRTLFRAVTQAREVAEQRERVEALEREVERLRTENEKMRKAMRRCTTCDYRLEVKRQRTENKLLPTLDEDDDELP